MKTNTFFSWNRFVALIRQDLLLNRNRYLLTLASICCALYLALIFQMSDSPSGFVEPNYQYTFSQHPGWGYSDFFMVYLIGLAGFIGLSFSNMSNKSKVAQMLMLPASNFEKYLYPLLFRVVFGVLIFVLVFWVDAQLARWTVQNSEMYTLNHLVVIPFEPSMLLRFSPRVGDNMTMIFSILATGMFAFVVPLYFKKLALIKSVLAYFSVLFAYVCFMVFLSHLLIPDTVGFQVKLGQFKVNELLNSIQLTFIILLNLVWIFLLFIGYFKLKEKRI